jgi:hypothetical protein
MNAAARVLLTPRPVLSYRQNMQKWEYESVASLEPTLVELEKHLLTRARELGAEGWEMVGISLTLTANNKARGIAFFKRPVQP